MSVDDHTFNSPSPLNAATHMIRNADLNIYTSKNTQKSDISVCPAQPTHISRNCLLHLILIIS